VSNLITLYHGGGASGWSAGEIAFSPTKSAKLFVSCLKILDKVSPESAQILRETNFELRNGINDFSDEFMVLFKKVDLDEFLDYEDQKASETRVQSYRTIATAFNRLGIFIRFIGVQLHIKEELEGVPSPAPKSASAAVRLSLADAEMLISGGNFIGAVDRIHTALHGYIVHLCLGIGLSEVSDSLELTKAIKLLRERHPKLGSTSPHNHHVVSVLKAVTSICATLGTLRNHGSLAHPNPALVDEADAELAVNSARTILIYLNKKVDSV
jgi:hypothetical protein